MQNDCLNQGKQGTGLVLGGQRNIEEVTFENVCER